MNSKLFLETKLLHGKTMISDLYFDAPYKITSPFYCGSHSDIMLMSASAGLLGGDTLDAKYVFREGSDVKIISQSYEKVFHTQDSCVNKTVSIIAEQNTKVKYMPYPIIPFAESEFYSTTKIHINPSSDFIYCDIFTCGRTGMNEYYGMKKFHSKTSIYVDKQLAFADNTLIQPGRFHYEKMGMWNGFTHNGMMYAYFSKVEEEEAFVLRCRQVAEERMSNCYVGVTKGLRGIVVRVLAYSGDEIFNFFNIFG